MRFLLRLAARALLDSAPPRTAWSSREGFPVPLALQGKGISHQAQNSPVQHCPGELNCCCWGAVRGVRGKEVIDTTGTQSKLHYVWKSSLRLSPGTKQKDKCYICHFPRHWLCVCCISKPVLSCRSLGCSEQCSPPEGICKPSEVSSQSLCYVFLSPLLFYGSDFPV